jgi:hypothetical protein
VSLSNWTQFKWPFAKMETFTRSEPFPTQEMKATYTGDKPEKKGAKLYYKALLNRKRKQKETR